MGHGPAFAFSGLHLGRAVFTVVLAGSAAVGLASAVTPQVMTMGPGESILASAHPAFTPALPTAGRTREIPVAPGL